VHPEREDLAYTLWVWRTLRDRDSVLITVAVLSWYSCRHFHRWKYCFHRWKYYFHWWKYHTWTGISLLPVAMLIKVDFVSEISLRFSYLYLLINKHICVYF